MKLFAFSGIALSLGLLVTTSSAQNYAAQSNTAFQQYQANYRDVAHGSRYRSARTAFRMNLQDASGSEVSDSLPSPSDVKSATPDRQVIGSSPAHPTPAATPSGSTSVLSSHSHHATDAYTGAGCNTCTGGDGYVNYGSFGSTSCNAGGSCGLFGGGAYGSGSGGLGLNLGNKIGCGCNDVVSRGGALGGFGASNGCGGGWYGAVTGLLMTRQDDYGQNLSYDSANANATILKTDACYDEYWAGAETRLGKYLSNNWAIEGAYWGLYPDIHESSVFQSTLGGDLRTSLGFNQLLYDPGTGAIPVGQVFGDATRTSVVHRLRRSYEVHNAEINFVNAQLANCSRFSYSFLMGARFFKYNDGFTFSTDYANSVFGDDPANELHYDVDVDNNLIGFQMGSRMNYRIGCGLSVNGGANFGVYNNHVTQLQRIRGGNGFAYDVANNEDYYIESSDDDLAFLGDLSLGLAYDIGCSWRVTGGYRLLAASGIANSTNQIPRDRDFYIYDTVRGIDSHDSLILHGAYFGVEHTW